MLRRPCSAGPPVIYATTLFILAFLGLALSAPLQHEIVMPTEVYERLFSFIKTDPAILDKSLKYSQRTDEEQKRVLSWAIHDPTFSQYVVEQIAKNYKFGWVIQLSPPARQELLRVILIDYKGQDRNSPAVMGQLTQQLHTNPEISSYLQREFTAVQPVYG